jgi:glycosyltransferase involved in cell wall biosynthesis
MAKPTVSIVTAAWTRAQYIGIGIQSAIDQTFQDWELIIVDDGSPDNTAQVVAEWQKRDKRIKYIRLEHVGRIAVVSNAGLRAAQGEFVAILDDDDYWIDNRKLEKQVNFLRSHPDYIACGGWFKIINGEGDNIGQAQKPETDEAIRKVMLTANGIANSTSMFRREPAGLYDESMPQFADWEFYLRLGKQGKLYNFPEYFLAYRMWRKGSSFVNQRANARTALTIFWMYRRDYPGVLRAFVIAYSYWLYSFLPVFVRQALNSSLSRMKKALFSK